MLTKNHEKLTIEVKRHIEADAVVQGDYWDGSKGCFIGCLAHSNDATKLSDLYGLPLPLVRICENIFENLPAEDAKCFFAAIPAAVGRDGKDLSRVHWAFLASELRALPEVDTDTQKVIDNVIDGMDILASGGDWSEKAVDSARAAAYAARAAARINAYAAAYAAASAASAASADQLCHFGKILYLIEVADDTDASVALLRQRDTILRLIEIT